MRRFIDEHSVHRFDVVSTEAFQVRNKVRVSAVGLQHIVKLEVLNFRDIFLSLQFFVAIFVLFGQRDVPHDLHARKTK